jgi:hypothetical protein
MHNQSSYPVSSSDIREILDIRRAALRLWREGGLSAVDV